METKKRLKYRRAKKKVKDIKGFYKHVTAFVIVNIIFFIFKTRIFQRVLSETNTADFNIESWLNWNYGINMLLWGIVLLTHGLYAHRYKFSFIKSWENKKMRELMNKDFSESRTSK